MYIPANTLEKATMHDTIPSQTSVDDVILVQFQFVCLFVCSVSVCSGQPFRGVTYCTLAQT